MPLLYLNSNHQGAGKTALCASLTHHLKLNGTEATALKLLGNDENTTFRDLLNQARDSDQILPDNGPITKSVIKDIKSAVDRTRDDSEVLLIEGSSDLSESDLQQLVQNLNMKTIMVMGYSPELDVAQFLPWQQLFGDQLIGYVINGVTPYLVHESHTELLPAIRDQGLKCLGMIPEDRTLLGLSVSQIVSHLSGEIISGSEFSNNLIEHFLVGGLGLDSGVEYFNLKENKAVVVRGDRPDIQMAALQTPTSCLIATGGIEPIEYVMNEAEEENVPIVMVKTDTITTMEEIEVLHKSACFDHPRKLERYASLIEEFIDIPTIKLNLGLTQ